MAGSQELQSLSVDPSLLLLRDLLRDASLLADLLSDRTWLMNRLIILLRLALKLCALLSDFDRLRLRLGSMETLTDRLADFD